MGCSESKIHNVETLKRWKERKMNMKQSVSSGNSFAAAHFAYAATLNDTGAVLSNYAQSELEFPNSPPPQPRLHPPYGPPPPPSPPPAESDGVLAWDFFCMLMADGRRPNSAMREMVSKHGGGGGGGSYGGAVEKSEEEPPPSFENMNSLQLFTNLEDCFIKASKSAHEVSKILDADKLHHWYIADNRGYMAHMGHSTRLMRVITWNKSFNGSKIAISYSSKEKGTLATLPHKMLVLEKKLYDQVKVTDTIKHEYLKKIALLNKERKRDASGKMLERTQAIVNQMQTRYIVEMQLIDSIVSEINHLRDEQLYPKLVRLIEEMGKMWQKMQKQHEKQLAIMHALRRVRISQSRMEKNDYNLKHTQQIHVQVKIWCLDFENLMLYQKEYIKSLKNWLKVSIIPIDNSFKPTQDPKICSLLHTWQDQLEKLPEEQVKTAMSNLAGRMGTFFMEQMIRKKTYEETQSELMRVTRKFDRWGDKQMGKRSASFDEMDLEVMAERHIVVEELRRRLEEEEAAYQQQWVEAKDNAMTNLISGFAEVFTAMGKFSCACADMYGKLEV